MGDQQHTTPVVKLKKPMKLEVTQETELLRRLTVALVQVSKKSSSSSDDVPESECEETITGDDKKQQHPSSTH